MTVIEYLEIIDATTLSPDVDHLIGCCVDFPRRGDLGVGSRVEIIGWVVGRHCPVVILEFVHGDQLLFQSPLTIERPDVAAIYPDAPWAERSGFQALVPLLSMSVQEIHVRAVLDDLTRTEFATVQLRRSWRAETNSDPSSRMSASPPSGEVEILTTDWDGYWRDWQSNAVDPLPGLKTRYPGDEWTVEDDGDGKSPYGLDTAVVSDFDTYIRSHLLDLYLPHGMQEGLEIGSGGGRLTALLAPRASILHLVEPSETVLRYLQQRFKDVPGMRYHFGDGRTLPALRPMSLDFAFSWDVFVHFEPRLVYWYLKQIKNLLRPGGVGIVHYADLSTPLGWLRFERYLERNVQERIDYSAFGVMCPEIMARFLKQLQFEVVTTDVGLIPRDAVAVFRQES